MTSRYPQYRYRSVSSDGLPSQAGSTLAYDPRRGRQVDRLPPAQGLDRTLARVPKPENEDTKLTQSFNDWLGKQKVRTAGSPERLRITEPRPITPPSRPKRPVSERAPSSTHRSQIVPELERPMPPRKPVRTDGDSLGGPSDALRSNPAAWINNLEKRLPPKQILLRPQSRDSSPRDSSTRENSPRESSSIGTISRGPNTAVHTQVGRNSIQRKPTPDDVAQQMKSIKAERRKGRIFLDGDIPKGLYEFPDPETWHGKDSEGASDEDDRIWEDAGFDDVYEPEPDRQVQERGHSTIPTITVSEPNDDGNQAQNNGGSNRLLGVTDCYDAILRSQKKEIRLLKNKVNYLLPLACIIAETEEIDLDNTRALEKALRNLVNDRNRLYDLYSLAEIVAKDQRVDISDFKALPEALRKALGDRDDAKHALVYNEMVIQTLEKRVRRAQSGEDYVRF